MRIFQRLLAPALVLALAVQPLLASWSIVIVNTKTGEVGIASAVCTTGLNTLKNAAVVVSSNGVGVVQGAIETDGVRKATIRAGLEAGLTPAQILSQLSVLPGHNRRVYGIVDFGSAPVAFLGSLAGAPAYSVVGVNGDLRYAIQGELLVGPEPIDAAEAALLNVPGDLGQKLMAAMEAAAATGGDGSCSCNVFAPASCGSPPSGNNWISSLSGFILIARAGDSLGNCTVGGGCATGSYYLKRNYFKQQTSPAPDAVGVLRQKYEAWRAALAGRPDHLLSKVSSGAAALVADGLSSTSVVVQLVDVDGHPLTQGGASITLKNLSGAPAVTVPGAVTDHGDGSYEFALTAGFSAGADLWELTVDDGQGKVRLYPQLGLAVDPLVELHSGFASISAAAGGFVPLTLNLGAARAGQPYQLLASSTGTVPGTPFPGGVLPLNRGRLLKLSMEFNTSKFQNTSGVLDSNGRAIAGFMAPPGFLAPLAGGRVDWSALVLVPDAAFATAPTGFDVAP